MNLADASVLDQRSVALRLVQRVQEQKLVGNSIPSVVGLHAAACVAEQRVPVAAVGPVIADSCYQI